VLLITIFFIYFFVFARTALTSPFEGCSFVSNAAVHQTLLFTSPSEKKHTATSSSYGIPVGMQVNSLYTGLRKLNRLINKLW
jgi:hypothetical protein